MEAYSALKPAEGSSASAAEQQIMSSVIALPTKTLPDGIALTMREKSIHQ